MTILGHHSCRMSGKVGWQCFPCNGIWALHTTLPVPGAEAVTAGIHIYAYITRKGKVKYFLQAHLIYFLTNSYRKMSVQSLTFIIKIFLLLQVRWNPSFCCIFVTRRKMYYQPAFGLSYNYFYAHLKFQI